MTSSHTDPLPRFPFEAAAALEPPAEWAEFREKCPVARVARSIPQLPFFSPDFDVRDNLQVAW